MRAHKLQVTVPADHRLSVELPPDFPQGPAEVIVLAAPREQRSILKLAGVLESQTYASGSEDDPIARALDELREERSARLDDLAEHDSRKGAP